MEKQIMLNNVRLALFNVETIVMLQAHAISPVVMEALVQAVEYLRPVHDSLEEELKV